MHLQAEIRPEFDDTRDFSRWATTFMAEFREIGAAHQKAMQDNVIEPSEAGRIAEEIKDVIGAVAILLCHLNDPAEPVSFESDLFSISKTEGRWSVEMLTGAEKAELKDFKRWFDGLYSRRLRPFFSRFFDAMVDNKLDKKERTVLTDAASKILKELFYAYLAFQRV